MEKKKLTDMCNGPGEVAWGMLEFETNLQQLVTFVIQVACVSL